MPEMPDAPYSTLAPDWVSEVVSPSTENVDRAEKVPVYAREQSPRCGSIRWCARSRPFGWTAARIAHHDRAGRRVRAGGAFDAIELELALPWER